MWESWKLEAESAESFYFCQDAVSMTDEVKQPQKMTCSSLKMEVIYSKTGQRHRCRLTSVELCCDTNTSMSRRRL